MLRFRMLRHPPDLQSLDCQLGRFAVSDMLSIKQYGQANKLSVGQVVDELADKLPKTNSQE